MQVRKLLLQSLQCRVGDARLDTQVIALDVNARCGDGGFNIETKISQIAHHLQDG